jgi:hypothetical protein
MGHRAQKAVLLSNYSWRPARIRKKDPMISCKLASILFAAAACWAVLVPISPAVAHSGGLNAEGCHNNRKTGGYHCHRSGGGSKRPRGPQTRPSRFKSGNQVFYRNCSEARAAGAAPIMRGEPGYAGRLDRDNDGVACE